MHAPYVRKEAKLLVELAEAILFADDETQVAGSIEALRLKLDAVEEALTPLYQYQDGKVQELSIRYVGQSSPVLQWGKDCSYVLCEPNKDSQAFDHPTFGRVTVASVNGGGEVRWWVTPSRKHEFYQPSDRQALHRFGILTDTCPACEGSGQEHVGPDPWDNVGCPKCLGKGSTNG